MNGSHPALRPAARAAPDRSIGATHYFRLLPKADSLRRSQTLVRGALWNFTAYFAAPNPNGRFREFAWTECRAVKGPL